MQAPAGRHRFNVLGALDAISHQLVTVTNDTYINAQSVCLLMQKLRRLTPELPIVLILDNARYQKCALVWADGVRSENRAPLFTGLFAQSQFD